MDLIKGMRYDEMDRMVPAGDGSVATEAIVRPFERAHSTIHMKDRQPLGVGHDEVGNRVEVVASFSTDPEDPEGSIVTTIVRDNRNQYGFTKPDGGFVPLDPHANKDVVFEGGDFALGARYDATRDTLSVNPEVGLPGKNGRGLIETMAMFPPAPEQTQ